MQVKAPSQSFHFGEGRTYIHDNKSATPPPMNIPAPIFKRTRIAPTPSGYLHLGNILSFALTGALARKAGAKILLRIDDLDRDRANKLYIQDIFDTLNFLELSWDEGPRNFEEYEDEWSQRHRLLLYEAALRQLKEQNAVFACTCSRAQIRQMSADDSYPGTCRRKNIPLDAENVSWRLETDEDVFLAIKALSGTNTPATLPGTMRDFVVRKKDGYPAYQLTSLLDDINYEVDLVVRGADLWPSTLAQQYLAGKIGAGRFQDITFYHHPLLMASGERKLSKSAGDTSVHYLRGQGKKPADVYLAIGQMLGSNEPVRNWQELAALFDRLTR